MTRQCSGTISVTIPCVPGWTGGAWGACQSNGIIQKSEAVQAVVDYFNGIIQKPQAVKVVLAYFG